MFPKDVLHCTSGNNLHVHNFYTVYFKFAYFLLCSPFHLSKSKVIPSTSFNFTLVKWWPQKFLVMTFLLLTSFWIYVGGTHSNFYAVSNTPPSKNPTLLFQSVWRFLNAFGLIVQIKILWFDNAKFGQILRLISNQFSENNLSVPPIKFYNISISTWVIAVSSCVMHVLVPLLEVLSGIGVPTLPEKLSGNAVMSGNTSHFENILLQVTEYSWSDMAYFVVYRIGWFHR